MADEEKLRQVNFRASPELREQIRTNCLLRECTQQKFITDALNNWFTLAEQVRARILTWFRKNAKSLPPSYASWGRNEDKRFR